MKALTIRQPKAWATATGARLVDNRPQEHTHRGPIAIYAAAPWDESAAADPRIRRLYWGQREHDTPMPAPQPHSFADRTGGVIATAELVDCHPAHEMPDGRWCCAPWGDGPDGVNPVWHLALRKVLPLRYIVRCAEGGPDVWDLPDLVAVEVQTTPTWR